MESQYSAQAASLDGINTPAPWQKAASAVFGRRTAQEHAAHLLPYIKTNSRILDVGCGVGSITVGFAVIAPEGSIVGFDTDSSAIDAAKDLAKQKNLINMELSTGNVYDLSRFPEESFDIVHAHQVILHLKYPVQALIGIRRLLKPGGLIAIRDTVDMHYIPKDPLMEKYLSWYQDYRQKSGTVPQAGLHHHVWMHEAGFSWEKIVTSTAAHGFSEIEAKRANARAVKSTFRSIGVKMGYGPEEDFDDIEEHWMAWAEKDESRMLGLDSVVLAWK